MLTGLSNSSLLPQDLIVYLNHLTILILFGVGGFGIILTYFGQRWYCFIVFLSGLVPGIIMGILLGILLGLPEIGIVFTAIIAGLLGGYISIEVLKVSIFMMGALLGAVLALVFNIHEPIIIVIVACIGGYMALHIYDIVIVVGSSFTGAGMLWFCSINVLSLIKYGKPSMLAGNYFSYCLRLIEGLLRNSHYSGATRLVVADIIIFLLFFISGIAVQLSFFKSSSKTVKKNKERVAASKEKVSLPEHHQPSLWILTVYQAGRLLKKKKLSEGEYFLGLDTCVDINEEDSDISHKHLMIRAINNRTLFIQTCKANISLLKGGTENISEEYIKSGTWYQSGNLRLVFSPAI